MGITELPKLIVFIGECSHFNWCIWCLYWDIGPEFLMLCLVCFSSFLFSLWFSSARHSDRLKTTVEYSCCSLREVSHTNERRDRSAYFLKACHWPAEVFPATSTVHSAFKTEKVHVWAVQHGCAPTQGRHFHSLGVLQLVAGTEAPIHLMLMPVLPCFVLLNIAAIRCKFFRVHPLDHLLILSLTWQTLLV